MRNPFAPITDAISRAFRPRNTSDEEWDSLMGIPFGALNTLRESQDDYGNAYPNIRAIADRFFAVRPFAKDDTGMRMTDAPQAIRVMSAPNQQMSGVDFRNAIATMSLVHNKTYILVWENVGGKAVPATPNIREQRIAGFTFLQGVVETVTNGVITYQTGTNTYTDGQVMVINDINPYDLSKGYSPARSVRKWATMEDFAADYTNGFFKNGGVPTGQFLITAPSKKEYEDVVKEMKHKYQGASKNGTAMYSYVPTDPITGKASQASVTWVPFNVTNKDLTLGDLLDRAEKKIDSAYRVSAFLRGMDEAPNFATAQVIERNFIENTMRPFLTLRWGRIQHELNRITGGLGYAIGFEITTPNIQEEVLAKSQSDQATAVTVNLLKAQGYTLANIVAAGIAPEEWLELETPEAANEDETIDDDGTTDDLPDQTPPTPGTSTKSKKKDNSHSHEVTDEDIAEFFASDSEQAAYATQLEVPARQLMEKQVNRAMNALGTTDKMPTTFNKTQEEIDDEADETAFLDAMMDIIVVILLSQGAITWEEGKSMIAGAGIDQEMGTYIPTDDAKNAYRSYLKTVFNSYSDDTKTRIRDTLAAANESGVGIEQTRANLAQIPVLDEYRVKRLAVAEANRSYSQASVESMQKMNNDLEDFTIQQSMQSETGTPCQYCATFIDVWRTVGHVMSEKGSTVTGIDGGTFVNNWDNNHGHDIHPNGHCDPVFRLIEDATGKVIGS